jgi:PUB domain
MFLTFLQLNTLRVLLKNVADPLKSQDMKYRTLKLNNPKLVQTVWNISYIQTLWFEQTLGFVLDTTTTTTTSTDSDSDTASLILVQLPADLSVYQPLLTSLAHALAIVSHHNHPHHKKARTESAPTNDSDEKLSEKQKARRLLAEKERLEKLASKQERNRQLQMLQQDKHTRIHDPNWKPGLAAACAKSGTSISTFRDKYGEN